MNLCQLLNMSIICLFLSWPWFGIFTNLGYFDRERNQYNSLWNTENKFIFLTLLKSFLWFLLWPGVYFIIGIIVFPYKFKTFIPINEHTLWWIYWIIFFIIGRLLDYIPFLLIHKSLNILKLKNTFIKSLKLFFLTGFFTIIFILFAIYFEFLAFFVPIIVLSPLLIILSSTPESSILLGIPFNISILFGWTLCFGSVYIFTAYIRGHLLYIVEHKFLHDNVPLQNSI